MTNAILIKETHGSDFLALVEYIRDVAQENGFGILYEINFQQKFKAKLNIEFDHYHQLWVCNPSIGYNLLNTDKSIWSLLPCPICIYQEWDKYFVSIVKPSAQLWLSDNEAISLLAQKADCLVQDVFDKI